jgi:hypothetical protein
MEIPVHDHFVRLRSSDATLELVQRWLRQCEQHENCEIPEDELLPARTIFVGEDNSEIKLSENCGTVGQYTCLSHCWGTLQLLKTQTHSIKKHRQTIPWDVLPRTFKHAIELTRRLGIKHIWIDSLCILQDDEQDWALESAKMASIYSNAYLTLAATNSKDADGGLSHTIEVPFEFVLQPFKKSIFVTPATHQGSSPLLLRGWVLQERLLSPRVVHFNNDELAWECNSITDCECGQDHPLGDGTTFTDKPPLWRTIVEQFSHLLLTKPEDKLPALSGVPQSFRSRPEQGVR